MRTIGIIRKVDSLGRIVIPKEIRDFFQIGENDRLEIAMTTDGIWIKKPGYEVRKREEKGNE